MVSRGRREATAARASPAYLPSRGPGRSPKISFSYQSPAGLGPRLCRTSARNRETAAHAGGSPQSWGCPQGQGGHSQGWGRGAPKVGEAGVNRDEGGQTYPGAHEGNLLVVEAVHGAGEAGSAPGPLSIDAGPGRGVPPGLRQVRGWGVEGTGRGQPLAPATPGAGSVRVRGRHASPGSRPAPAVAGRSPPARDVT